MAKKEKGNKDTKAQKSLKPLSQSQIKMISRMPFLIPLLYKKKQPPGMNLALAKYSLKNTLPKVNLLPPIVALVVKQRKVKFTLGLTGVSILIISAFVWLIAGLSVGQSNKDIALLNTQVAAIQNKVNSLLPSKMYIEGINASILAANTKLGTQLNYAKLFGDIESQAGSGTIIVNMSTKLINSTPNPNAVKGAPPANQATQCGPIDNPFAQAQVQLAGCVSFSGNISDRAQLPALIQRLSTLTYLQDISVTQSGQPGAGFATPFSGSAAITQALVLPTIGGIK